MKAAVLGIGDMGCSVIEHLQACAGVTGIVGYDIRQEQVTAVEERYRVPATTRLEEILRDREVRLVFVTASNDAHKALALQALEAGKAVLCEKPMAVTLADAREMVEVAEGRGAFLQIGFELRYSKLYTRIKDWIEAGLLGDVVNIHCYYICSEFHHKGSWRNRKATGGSMFGEKLSHYVDLPRWWIGADVREVSSVCAPNIIPYYEVRDNYHTTYRFQNGAVSHLTFMMGPAAAFPGDPLRDSVSQQKDDGHALRYLVVGTKGAAEASVFDRTLKRWEFHDTPVCLASQWVEKLNWESKEDHAWFHNTTDQTHDIVHRVANGLPPKTTARDAYETMRVCFAAELSADTGHPVEVAKIEAPVS